eukprot:Selendium_serpulae@DN3440_c0_g1_i3.p1
MSFHDMDYPSLEELVEQESLKWIFVGGKGGVGKTTTSCSVAMQLAKRRESVLVLSTDPAHNLSDAFSQKFTGSPTLVNGFTNLYAMELSTETQANTQFRLGSDSVVSALIPEFLASLPGADEALGFAELMNSVQALKHSVIVFDTAPTGHTLRLLGFPVVLEKALGHLKTLQVNAGNALSMLGSVAGDFSKEEISAKLDNLRALVTYVRETFTNVALTTFVCVCIPEFLSVYETERLVQELAKQGIDCSNIVVNQVLFPTGFEDVDITVPPKQQLQIDGEGAMKTLAEENTALRDALELMTKKVDAYESSFHARRSMQRKYLTQIEALYGEDFHVVCMPLQPEEVRGADQLNKFSELLIKPRPVPK